MLLIAVVAVSTRNIAFVPGLLLIGLGLGAMLTPSVNVVQPSFPENLQGEISGLSRSMSNLGSSFGTAIAGTIRVAAVARGNAAYGWAMVSLAVLGLVGLGGRAAPSGKGREAASVDVSNHWIASIPIGDNLRAVNEAGATRLPTPTSRFPIYSGR